MKKTARRNGKKPSRFNKKFVIFGLVLPVLIVGGSAVSAYTFAMGGGGSEEKNEFAKHEDIDTPEELRDVNIDVEKPAAETKEVSVQKREEKQKAEAEAKQKKDEEAERKKEEARKLEQETRDKLTKELQIKQAREDAMSKICFIGDSITAWGAADNTIANLGGDFSGINLARPGSTTGEWLSSIGSDIGNCRKPNLKAAMIMLGTNDAGHVISVSTYAANMGQIIGTAGSLGVPVIVNCIPRLGSQPELSLAYCQGLSANGATNTWELFDKDAGLLSSDGIHPSGAGYATLGRLWADAYLRIVGN